MDIANFVLDRILADKNLQFRDTSNPNHIREGICPECQKRSLWLYSDNPWVMFCERMNNCGVVINTREYYKDICADFAKKFPSTIDDPKASARAFLQYRGFDTEKMENWYSQGQIRLKDGTTSDCLRFFVDGKCYWSRLLYHDDIRRNNGKKAKIVGKYHGKGWQPPQQKIISCGDQVWITEGILKSCALHFIGKKTITGLSANNLPIKLIEPHKNKDVTWVIALDNDEAGQYYSNKYKHQLRQQGYKVIVALPESGKDWDDIFRSRYKNSDGQWVERLTDQYLEKSLWRGAANTAFSADEKAFWLYIETPQMLTIFNHKGRIYRSIADNKTKESANQVVTLSSAELKKLYTTAEKIDGPLKEFKNHFNTTAISNFVIDLIHIENHCHNEAFEYCFKVKYEDGDKTKTSNITLNAYELENRSTFRRALIEKLHCHFDGSQKELELIESDWMKSASTKNKVDVVRSIGYNKTIDAYIFPEFGYKKGEMVDKNNDGYLSFSDQHVKTSLNTSQDQSSNYLRGSDQFNHDWFSDFYYVYNSEGLATLSFWAGSLFATQIREMHDSFTLYELSGKPQTGKTTLIRFLWRLLGIKNNEGIDPQKVTERGLIRLMSRSGNLPIVLLEGDRNEVRKKATMFDYDVLKTAWNGGVINVTAVKNVSLDVDVTAFTGSIMISQNTPVDGSEALLSRFVHTELEYKESFERQDQAISRMASYDINELASFRNQMLKHEPEFLKSYQSHFKQAVQRLTAACHKNSRKLTSRILKNHAQLLAIATTMQPLFKGAITDKHLEDLEAYLLRIAYGRELRISGDHPLVARFWEYYEALNTEYTKTIKTTYERTVINHLPDSGKIAINLVQFDKICGDQNLQRLDTDELRKLLPNCKSRKFIGRKTVRSKLPEHQGRLLKCWVFEQPIDSDENTEYR